MSQSDLYELRIARGVDSLERMLKWWDSLDRGWKANAIALLVLSAIMLI
jgi:hypothetical protein